MANTSETLNLSSFVTRNTDGSIDVQQTHVKFTNELNKLIQTEKADGEVIAQAVEKVWKDNPDQKTFPMPALVHYALQNLEYSPESYGDLSERVANYIRAKSNMYRIGKGKGGGVSRVDAGAPMASTPPSGSIRPKATGTTG